MARQIDIDLLLPKIARLKTGVSDGTSEKQLTVEQVLWILEQECAIQNSVTNTTASDTNAKNGLYIRTLDRFRQEWASSANVVDSQDELSEIHSSRV